MRYSSFEHLLSCQAEAIPERTALLYGADREVCTYRALHRAVLEEAAPCVPPLWRQSL